MSNLKCYLMMVELPPAKTDDCWKEEDQVKKGMTVWLLYGR